MEEWAGEPVRPESSPHLYKNMYTMHDIHRKKKQLTKVERVKKTLTKTITTRQNVDML